MQSRFAQSVIVGACDLELRFDFTQGGITVEYTFNGWTVAGGQFLGDMRQGPVRGPFHRTVVRMQFTANQGQQCGFAGTVGTGDPAFPAGMNGDVDIRQQ